MEHSLLSLVQPVVRCPGWGCLVVYPALCPLPGARPAVPPPGFPTTGFAPPFSGQSGGPIPLGCISWPPAWTTSLGSPGLFHVGACFFLWSVFPGSPSATVRLQARLSRSCLSAQGFSATGVSPRISTRYCPPLFWTCGGASPHPEEGVGFFPLRGGARRTWARVHLVPRTAGPPSWISRC